MRNKMKKSMVMLGIMCMLFTVVHVNSNTEIMPCGAIGWGIGEYY